MHDRVAAWAKEMGEVVVPVAVDGHAIGQQAGGARFDHRSAGVFKAPAAFVDVEVVGFAVGEDQQQPLALGARRQALRRQPSTLRQRQKAMAVLFGEMGLHMPTLWKLPPGPPVLG